MSLALSNTACEMLRVLSDHLHQMQTLLSKSLFNDFWQHLAARLNDYILKEVMSTHSSFTTHTSCDNAEGKAFELQARCRVFRLRSDCAEIYGTL